MHGSWCHFYKDGLLKSSKQISYHMVWAWYEVADKIRQLNLPTPNPPTDLYSTCINSYHCSCHCISCYHYSVYFCCHCTHFCCCMLMLLSLCVNITTAVKLLSPLLLFITCKRFSHHFKYCCMSLCKCCHQCNVNVTTTICIVVAVCNYNCHCHCM